MSGLFDAIRAIFRIVRTYCGHSEEIEMLDDIESSLDGLERKIKHRRAQID